jgi:hypothetical protein
MHNYYLSKKLQIDREEAERRACKHIIEQESLEREAVGNQKAQPQRLRFWFAYFHLRLPGLFTHRSRQPLCTAGVPQSPFNAR